MATEQQLHQDCFDDIEEEKEVKKEQIFSHKSQSFIAHMQTC